MPKNKKINQKPNQNLAITITYINKKNPFNSNII